ncbi:MAG: sn-glycerol-3-phosphate import ATP-binding protein UgpC [Pseudomonadota bacterium]
MAGIALSDLRKSYGPTEVLHGIGGEIEDGEFIVIVGPSGCGKSTLLRMVAGLETVTSGEIRIGDRRVNELEPAERDIAMVFQNYALYPHMSVFGNMSYGLKIKGLSRDEIKTRVEAAADILEIRPFLDRKPRQLSGGQRQRVAMGRAIVREPEVFLFDEPLSNLDAKLRVQMRLEIKKLQRRLGTTSIYVTHDQVEAMTLGDRLMVLNAGNVEQFGSPIELYERPETIFVAGFIGSPAMNFLPVSLLDDRRTMQIAGTLQVVLEAQVSTGLNDLTLGIRPEHMVEASDGEGVLKINVEVVEQLGAETLVHGTLSGNEHALTASLPGVRRIEAGSEITLAVPGDKVHLFDPSTGKRLG